VLTGNALISSKKPTAEIDDGLVTKDVENPIELFLASVAELDGDVVRLVMTA
jgi:hypothetical protein